MLVSTTVLQKKVLIIGATSAIAQATAVLFAKEKYELYLLARDKEKLTTLKQKLKYLGASLVDIHSFQADNLPELKNKLTRIFQKTKIDIALIAHGILPKQKLAEKNWELLHETIQTNIVATLFVLEFIADKMEQEKQGSIVTITSIAVDNSNHTNYIYASSKAMVASFLRGLRIRLAVSKVKVIDVRPALVKTPMTAHLQKKYYATTHDVAAAILQAILQQKYVIYIPSYWRWVMLVIRNIPNNILTIIYRTLGKHNKN